MRNKNGFTLIELLAVIVILAVIALIATPLITNTIETSRRNSFKQTVHGIVKTIELDYINNVEPNDLVFKDYNFPNSGLEFKGDDPKGGFATVDKDGDIAIAVFDPTKKYCAVKTKNESDIRVITNYKKCDREVAENLFINGYGEYGDNSYMNNYVYKDGYFSIKTSSTSPFLGKHELKINSEYTYNLSVEAKNDNTSAKVYMGLCEYNSVEGRIGPNHFMYVADTLTTLKQDLKNGDTVVYLDNISNFKESTLTYQNGFIIWNYKNYPESTYSKNSYSDLFMASGIDKTNHTITLNEEWDKGDLPAGTKLSQRNSGAAYNYGLAENISMSSTWETYTNTIGGTITNGKNLFKRFRPGTDYIRFMIMPNNNGVTPAVTMDLRNIVIKKIVK